MSTCPYAAIRLVDHRLDLVGRGDVANHAFDANPAAAKRLECRREPLFAAGAQHQRRARFGEAFRHFLSQPARSASDDGDAAAEIEQLQQWPHHLLWASMNFTSVAV